MYTYFGQHYIHLVRYAVGNNMRNGDVLRCVTVCYVDALRCVTLTCYGSVLWCVTEVLRCVTVRYFDALRCVTLVCYDSALRLCVMVRYGALR